MPRTENKSTPKVIGDVLYHESGGIVVGSSEWWAWLNHEANTVFYVELSVGIFTARKEPRRSGDHDRTYWYAYRHQGDKLYKCYLGVSERLVLMRLTVVARQITERIERSL